jgi:hypothetical protein
MSQSEDAEYRALVQQLMHAGWYRISDERNSAGGVTCRFRHGHLLDAPAQDARDVHAKDTKEAMRQLLSALPEQSLASTAGPSSLPR